MKASGFLLFLGAIGAGSDSLAGWSGSSPDGAFLSQIGLGGLAFFTLRSESRTSVLDHESDPTASV